MSDSRPTGAVLTTLAALIAAYVYILKTGADADRVLNIAGLTVAASISTGWWYLGPQLKRAPSEAMSFGFGAAFIGVIYFAVIYSIVDTASDLVVGRYNGFVELFTNLINAAVNVVVENFLDPVVFLVLFAGCGVAGRLGSSMVARRR